MKRSESVVEAKTEEPPTFGGTIWGEDTAGPRQKKSVLYRGIKNHKTPEAFSHQSGGKKAVGGNTNTKNKDRLKNEDSVLVGKGAIIVADAKTN